MKLASLGPLLLKAIEYILHRTHRLPRDEVYSSTKSPPLERHRERVRERWRGAEISALLMERLLTMGAGFTWPTVPKSKTAFLVAHKLPPTPGGKYYVDVCDQSRPRVNTRLLLLAAVSRESLATSSRGPLPPLLLLPLILLRRPVYITEPEDGGESSSDGGHWITVTIRSTNRKAVIWL